MVRAPIVSGQFYESSKDKLEAQIKRCFLSSYGPGKLPANDKRSKTLGIISPHAGYQFSGPCAAWSYKNIAGSIFPDTYVMLGLSHYGYGSCLSLEDWETPLGIVKNDANFGKELSKISGIRQNEAAHQNEHSIEVQLPFLQFINDDKLDKIRICPVIASPDIGHNIIAESIFKVIKKQDKKVMVIASSDFTHFGHNYGFLPFINDIKQNLYSLDNGALEHIKKLDSLGFLNYIKKTGATICGSYPIASLLAISRLLGAKKGTVLKYYTSGDIIDDYSSAVGYSSVSID